MRLVAPHVLNGLLEREASRVEADENVTAEPLFYWLLQQHHVVESANFNLFVCIEELKNFAHGSRS